MEVRKLKPTSAGTRFVVRRKFSNITQKEPHKPLTSSWNKNGGRNNQGRITVRHQGGGSRRHYRLIDFKRQKDNIIGRVDSIEYDPFRTCDIALITYQDGEKRYIIAPKDIVVGDEIISGYRAPMKTGNCMPIENMSLGSKIHCLELRPGKGGQLARSAGSYATLVNKSEDERYMLVRMTSGEMRKILGSCRATLGEVSNSEHKLASLGKAGASRWRGIRPTVRGSAMNPVDHPQGGGEGKTRGKIPRTPWGKCAKGKKTRHNKRTDKAIIKRIN